MKRTLLLVTTVLIVAALAIPQAGAGASQQAAAAAAKKGKPPKDPEPVFAIQMAISDPTGGNQLKGDGLDRQDPSMDADGDGFGDLTGAFPGLDIFYQDHRIDLDGHPMPILVWARGTAPTTASCKSILTGATPTLADSSGKTAMSLSTTPPIRLLFSPMTPLPPSWTRPTGAPSRWSSCREVP